MRSESQKKKKKNKREKTAKQMAAAAVVVNQFNAAARQKGYGRKRGKFRIFHLFEAAGRQAVISLN